MAKMPIRAKMPDNGRCYNGAVAKFVIFGAGAWGTAMALHLASLGHAVNLVARDSRWAVAVEEARENFAYLPGLKFPDNLHVDGDFSNVNSADCAFLACPTAGVVEFCNKIGAAASNSAKLPPLITLCKGFVPETHQLPLQTVKKILPTFSCGTLSGPTYARDVALGHPTAAVLAASVDKTELKRLQAMINGPKFRIYRTDDVLGVELGGSLKNPYAIGIGIAERFVGSENGRAALFTRTMAELVRIGVALGGKAKTFYGLSGLGDLVATGNGDWSRNRTFGLRIGAGENPREIIAAEKTTVEGYRATDGFHSICADIGVRCPILNGIWRILYGDAPAAEIGNSLMCGELREECDDYPG
ncbi:MAG: NAD(P)-dependent glycerol-3-phosphate dehydrogenase [Puniceicoccales bacterium]|nr:NAD(P)-dependent glycerol-3-phosphate dehydrogenase [Puniceicoccales bacterium]